MIEHGWYLPAQRILSPNFSRRPESTEISLLVIHNISLPPGEFGQGYVEKFFTNQLPVDAHDYFSEIQDLRVSSHLLIDRQGDVTQFVSMEDRAWHAGKSSFQGREECNDFSIGIELEGTDFCEFSEQQYQKLTRLTKDILSAYPAISLDRIVGHSDIAPGRKTDPGPYFDWKTYKAALKN